MPPGMPLSSASAEGLNGTTGFHNLETATGEARELTFSRGGRFLLREGNKVVTCLQCGAWHSRLRQGSPGR